MRNNSVLRPSRLRRRRRKILAVKFGVVFLLLIAFIFLLSWLSKIQSIQVEHIEISGNAMLSKEEVGDLIKEEMSVNLYKLFSRNSIFLYPKRSIENKILSDFKKVLKIEIKSNGLKSIIANITERKPEFTWCAGDADLELSGGREIGSCYFMDKEGVIFSEAPKFSGNSHMSLRYFGLMDDTNPIGKNYMESPKFKEIVNFISTLKNMGIITAGFQAEIGGEYKIYLQNGIKIISDNRQLFDKILKNIESILPEIDLKKDYSAGAPLKYRIVDLRFGNKIFLRNE